MWINIVIQRFRGAFTRRTVVLVDFVWKSCAGRVREEGVCGVTIRRIPTIYKSSFLLPTNFVPLNLLRFPATLKLSRTRGTIATDLRQVELTMGPVFLDHLGHWISNCI